jgi:hypothetical protein
MMMVNMVKCKWILQLAWKCFYNEFHMTLKLRDTKLKLLCLWVTSQCPSLKKRSHKNKLINKLLSFHALRDITTSFELVYTFVLEQTFNHVLCVNFKHEEDAKGKMP